MMRAACWKILAKQACPWTATTALPLEMRSGHCQNATLATIFELLSRQFTIATSSSLARLWPLAATSLRTSWSRRSAKRFPQYVTPFYHQRRYFPWAILFPFCQEFNDRLLIRRLTSRNSKRSKRMHSRGQLKNDSHATGFSTTTIRHHHPQSSLIERKISLTRITRLREIVLLLIPIIDDAPYTRMANTSQVTRRVSQYEA